MGQQQTKSKAISILKQALEQTAPLLSQEQKDAIVHYLEREL